MSAPLLDVDGVSASYGRVGRQLPVLANVSLCVKAGEMVGLIGPNGAGKSTLLKAMAGLQPRHAGEIRVLGKPLAAYTRRELARAVVYVPQQSSAAMFRRVVDMVALGRAPHRGLVSSAVDRAHVFDAIERLQLQPLALRYYSELSGGQRQRVLLARALAQQGRLLLLDEPTSDLDLRHQHAALATVRALCDEQGVAALIAIHDLSLAARYCDQLILLQHGRVQAQGPWQHVLTPDLLGRVYGVDARVGLEDGMPYVVTNLKEPAHV